MSKNKARYDITGSGIPFLSYAVGPTSTGWIFYMRIEGQNIHLQYCLNKGMIDVHVKVTGEIIWRRKLSPEALAQSIRSALKRSLKRYHPNQKMYVLGTQTISAILSPFTPKEGNYIHEVDFIKLCKLMLTESAESGLMYKVRIKDAIPRNILFGFQFSKSQVYAVIPLPDGYRLKFNLNMRRGIWAALPIMEGIDVLMKYLDKEGILDEHFEKVKEPLTASVEELKLMGKQLH